MTQSRRGSGPRRATEWFDTVFNQILPESTNTAISLSTNILDDEKKGMTVIRMLIDLQFFALSVNTKALLSGGIYIVESDALAVLALSDPSHADEQPGWTWRWSTVLSSDSTSISRQHVTADVHSMRKFPGEDTDLISVWELGAITNGAQITGIIRVLCKKA